MRPVNIVLLVLAGALGGAVLMRVTQPFHAPQIAEVKSEAPEPAPAVAKPPANGPAVFTQPQQPPPTDRAPGKPTRPVMKPKRAIAVSNPVRRAAIAPPKRVEFQHPTDAPPVLVRPSISEP